MREKSGAQDDDLIVILAGNHKPGEHKSEGGVKPEVKPHDHAVYTSAGLLRVALAQKYAAQHGAFARSDFHFLWVTDFPMFEWDEEESVGPPPIIHLPRRTSAIWINWN